jgi:amino acid transporter
MNPKKSEHLQEHMIGTYISLRYGLVFIAVALPLILWIGGYLREGLSLRGSMSAYYHNSMRDVFVGALFAMGACLYLYKGYSTHENVALNLAGIFTAGVALFPMELESMKTSATFTWGKVHGTCAFLSFACIAFVCWFCASDTLSEMKDEKKIKKYKAIYKSLGVLLVLSPAVAIFLTTVMQYDRPDKSTVFFVELFAMYVFALYWVVKSREIRATNVEQTAVESNLELRPLT